MGRIVEAPFEELEMDQNPKSENAAIKTIPTEKKAPKKKNLERAHSMIELDYLKHLDQKVEHYDTHKLNLTDGDIEIAHLFERDHFFGTFSTHAQDFDLKKRHG